MKLQRSDFVRSFLRCFAVQGSWNFDTYQAGGLTYVLIPLLTRIHAGDPVALRESLRGHASYFNSHPYLAPLAVGALARLEQEGADPERLERVRRALSSSLGALGDQLVWSGWRPACLLCGLLGLTLGAGAWTSVLIFFVAYNVGHLALRIWSFRLGWKHGPRGTEELSRPILKRAGRVLSRVSAGLVGAAAVALTASPLLAGSLGGGARWAGAGAAAVAACIAFVRPVTLGRLPAVALAVALVLAALLG